MRIQAVRIRNFRCLQDVQIGFDEVTTFVGPNGAGKSSVLRALDWFFNSIPDRLTEEDVYSGAPADGRAVVVEVVFGDLTPADRVELGDKYAPAGATTFTCRRTWDGDTDKMTGKALAYQGFDAVRLSVSAADKKSAYENVRAQPGGETLPRWTKVADVEPAMTVWESNNPNLLSETQLDTPYLFGFNGRNKLSGLFDFVFVTADLRAKDESVEGKKTVIGRILERAIDRHAANEELAQLALEVGERQTRINIEHLGSQLDDLAGALTEEVGAFTSGREVRLTAVSPDVRPTPVTINLAVLDAQLETSVDRQGHGFQRALLVSSLKLLANRGAHGGTDDSTILLAIEEPELFQHPSQARVFARVLRDLAEGSGGLQIAYATHSPYFVNPRFFDQVRRVSRIQQDPDGHAEVTIHHATLEAVAEKVGGYVTRESVIGRWDQVCTRNLAEALFAEAVVLVEGETDKGILDGIASRHEERQFELDGITVVAAGGKQHLFIPQAILSELGIPTLLVFDSDSGQADRMRANGNDRADKQDETTRNDNRALLRYLGLPEQDYPAGLLAPNLYVCEDDLERVIECEWASWEVSRRAIIDGGRGIDEKNAATYALAAKEAADGPGQKLLEVMSAARMLVR